MSASQRISAFVLASSLLLLVQPTAKADFGPLSGNALIDLPAGNSNTYIIQDATNDVAQSQWMTARGWTTGWNIQDLRVSYDSKSDTLLVGVNFVGIAGDSDGNGNPGTADPLTTASGGLDLAHMGGRKSISVGFAGTSPGGQAMGDPVMVAGVPALKGSASATGVDGFTVNAFVDHGGLAYSYGQSLASVVGTLAFDPSAEHPDFVFTLANVSKISGFNVGTGFYISAFAGSPDDVIAGEDTLGWQFVPGFVSLGQPQVVPEPSSFALIGLGGTLIWARVRRNRRQALARI